jgi:hypothetical protein
VLQEALFVRHKILHASHATENASTTNWWPGWWPWSYGFLPFFDLLAFWWSMMILVDQSWVKCLSRSDWRFVMPRKRPRMLQSYLISAIDAMARARRGHMEKDGNTMKNIRPFCSVSFITSCCHGWGSFNLSGLSPDTRFDGRLHVDTEGRISPRVIELVTSH